MLRILLLLLFCLQTFAAAFACDVEKTVQAIEQLVQKNQSLFGATKSGSAQFVESFTKCHGQQLYELKQRVDQLHQVNLVNLVNHYLNQADEAQLRQFFEQEFKQTGPSRGFHMLSDIDDTIVPRYKDTRFPGTSCYPGVKAFQESAQGLTCVTARPYLPLIDVEESTQCKLDHLQVRPRSVLLGSLSHLITNIDHKKVGNIKKYMELFPEKNFIWVGDNGQSDELVGQTLLTDPATKDRIAKSLIHTVDDDRRTLPTLVYFKTYIEAALALYGAHLITQDEVVRVAHGTVDDFHATTFGSEEQRQRVRSYIEESVATQPMSHRLAKRIQSVLGHLRDALNPT